MNELLAAIPEAISREELIAHLGAPDETRAGQPNTPGRVQQLMEELAGGDSSIQWADPAGFDEILVYTDPYRPRKRYLFGVRGGIVTQRWGETEAQ